MKLNNVVCLILCLGMAACAGHDKSLVNPAEDIITKKIYPDEDYKPLEASAICWEDMVLSNPMSTLRMMP